MITVYRTREVLRTAAALAAGALLYVLLFMLALIVLSLGAGWSA